MTIPSHIEVNYTEHGTKVYEWAFANRVPISGGIELTHRCNLRCVHCYVASDKYPKELDTEQWFEIIDQIAEAGCFWFYITGGEAMIRPDFLDIYLHAKKKGMMIVVMSNATCISEKIADAFADYPPQVVDISMYGASPDVFDKVGKVKFGYRRFLQGLERLLTRQIPIKLKTVALRENLKEVHRMRKFAESLGVQFRYDSIVNARLDNQMSPFDHNVTAKEAIDLEIDDPSKGKMYQQYCSTRLVPPSNDNVYQCGAGKSTFNIDPYGRLSVCLLSRRPNYPVLEGSFLEGFQGSVQTEINRKREHDEKCDMCNHHALCGNCQGYTDVLHGKHQSPVENLCELAERRVEAYGLKYEQREKR